jgi:hypothetical protein
MTKLPNPDDETMRRLLGEAGMGGPAAAGELSAAMMSANVAFLIGSIGPEKAAAILRDWAAAVMRSALALSAGQSGAVPEKQ